MRCLVGVDTGSKINPVRQLRSQKERGLTLLETLLALIMLSLLIVGVLGLLGSLLVASTKSTDSTAGTFVAQYLFDRASVTGPPTPEGGTVDGTEELHSHEEGLPVKFRYRMEWSKIGEAQTYYIGSRNARSQFGPDLWHVKVTVWWMVENPDDGRAEGGGKRTLTMERLVSHEPPTTE